MSKVICSKFSPLTSIIYRLKGKPLTDLWLDENSIFYLRARGINRDAAQKILIKAFAKEVIDDFSLSSLQDISEIALDSWIDG